MSGKVTVLDEGQLGRRLEWRIKELRRHARPGTVGSLRVYGVPRGGALALHYGGAHELGLTAAYTPEMADVIVDDIIDSGRTRNHWQARFPDKPFIGLVDKTQKEDADLGWVVFPWEQAPGSTSVEDKERDAQETVVRLLEHIGEDPKREGLLETPVRVVKSWGALFGGYGVDPASVFKTFEEGACDEMVLLRNVEFYSTCLAGSTFIDTPKGRIPISRLQDGEFVYCWDENACKMTVAQARNPRVTGRNKRLWRVYTDKDTVLCTGNHKFLTHTRGWVAAQDLLPGDSVVALNKGTIVTGDKPRAHVVWTGMAKAIPEHRFVYSEINGELDGKMVHHIDGRANNNSPENLTALSGGEHTRLHRLTGGPTGFALFTDKQRLDMREKQMAAVRASQTEAVRQKRSASVKKYWDALTPAQRAARNHCVLLVEKTDWFEDVWCMDVPRYHNFVANGMVVHNCEHHMIPFHGTASIAYIPNKKVIGVSKLVRLLEVYARRLQIQERLCQQVTSALDQYLQPLGSACVLRAQHMCMTARGVQKQGSEMVTSSLTGVFKTNPQTRAEFLQLAGV